MSIDLDYVSLRKSEENELCKEFQVVLGWVRLYILYICIYGLYNYMVGVKYISYLTPTMSDNIIIILVSLCFDGTLELCSYHEYKHEISDIHVKQTKN